MSAIVYDPALQEFVWADELSPQPAPATVVPDDDEEGRLW